MTLCVPYENIMAICGCHLVLLIQGALGTAMHDFAERLSPLLPCLVYLW